MLALLLLLTACGGVRHHQTASAAVRCGELYCGHGHIGERCVSSGFPGIIVQIAPGKLGCDSRPDAHPSTTVAAPPPPSPVSTAEPGSPAIA